MTNVYQQALDDLAGSGEPKAWILSVEELDALPRGAVVVRELCGTPEIFYAVKCGDGGIIDEEGLTYTTYTDYDTRPDVDGFYSRWWDRMPTGAERAEADNAGG